MVWGRVKRELLEASERQRAAAEQAAAELRVQVAALDAERRTLVDRIVQLSGQPALYAAAAAAAARLPAPAEPAPAASAAAEDGKGAEFPSPKRMLTFDDLHDAFKKADKSGTLKLGAGRIH